MYEAIKIYLVIALFLLVNFYCKTKNNLFLHLTVLKKLKNIKNVFSHVFLHY
jgi:hypothetical protein